MKRLFTLLFSTVVFAAHSQPTPVFTLFDIFSGIGSSGAGSTTGLDTVAGKLLFDAYTPAFGRELWISDGTPAGTKLLADINPGGASSSPFRAAGIHFNGKFYFDADDGTHGDELWVTDGTSTGTYMLKDIFPGSSNGTGNPNPNPFYFCRFGTKLFFAADDGVHGREPWVTDGTAAGTYMIKDVNPGIDGGVSFEPILYNGKVYFAGYDAANGQELWVTDGTSAGTHLVKDIQPGVASSAPVYFTVYNGKLYFVAETTVSGSELWVTDGTAAGTTIFKELNPGAGDGVKATQKVEYKGKLVFSASDTAFTSDLWMTDGTLAGTTKIKDMNMGLFSGSVGSFANLNNKLYFPVINYSSNNRVELWETDGTDAGTKLVFANDTIKTQLPWVYKNNLYFFSAPSSSGYASDIYISDGTAAGTKVIAPANKKNNTQIWMRALEYNNALYLTANYTAASGEELWSLKDTTGSAGISAISSRGFTLSPNPNNGTFMLQLDDANFSTAVLQVYDAVGRKVYEQQVKSRKETIRLQQPAGIYTAKLQMDNAVLTKQLVIE
ncbi:MAG TPA: ELWxxDGT repeat protein [Flavipsychrobacter sp.]|nr:ELWxxDGT repeat protein [Flavipsychrobacter sp.]